MKILIFGAGAVGLTFGGFLSRHHEVTLLGRAKQMKAIRRHGLTITGIWGRHHFKNFHLAMQVRALAGKKFDLVLFTVKAYDTEAAARQLKKVLKRPAPVIVLQNGLGNIETVHRFFSKTQVLAGRVIFGALIPKPGQVKITVIANPTAIGETAVRRETPRVKKVVREFKKAGLPVVSCADVQSVLWAKVIYNCALNPLASILGCHYGFLMEKDETRLVMDEVIQEIYALARKMKVKLNPPSAEKYQKLFYSQLVPRTYNHHPSMLQDLRRGKQTEIDALSGAVARLGAKYGVPVPVNALLAAAIRKKEKENL
jgi:2-dehydropantoate 2-reductase